MTKKQLVEKLKDVPDDYQVCLASDAEGNNFDLLEEVHIETEAKFDREEREFLGSIPKFKLVMAANYRR